MAAPLSDQDEWSDVDDDSSSSSINDDDDSSSSSVISSGQSASCEDEEEDDDENAGAGAMMAQQRRPSPSRGGEGGEEEASNKTKHGAGLSASRRLVATAANYLAVDPYNIMTTWSSSVSTRRRHGWTNNDNNRKDGGRRSSSSDNNTGTLVREGENDNNGQHNAHHSPCSRRRQPAPRQTTTRQHSLRRHQGSSSAQPQRHLFLFSRASHHHGRASGGCHPLWGCLSTFLLTTSVVLWFAVSLYNPGPVIILEDNSHLPIRDRVQQRRNPNNAAHHDSNNNNNNDGSGGWNAANSMWQHAAQGLTDVLTGGAHGRGRGRSKKKKADQLDPDCYRPDWQEFSFPNCNEIHEIDLLSTISQQRSSSSARGEKNSKAHRLGFLAHGFWRSVWAVDPRASFPRTTSTPPVVLKMMLGEHEVTSRNFDRHRRDAIVMERLTASANVVDIYGYCGNSVLTEYIATPLDDIIVDDYDKQLQQDGLLIPDTERNRIRLFLEVARGLKDLHDIRPGGPIIHADIQARQFLVNLQGTVKINDFNRCRFMALHKRSGKPCKLKISTAPGKARSPEEYDKRYLDEKLDIYSIANVYYGILTRDDGPWEGYSTREMQRMAIKGKHPRIEREIRDRSAADAALADIVDQCYSLDPTKRPSASELVYRLERLL